MSLNICFKVKNPVNIICFVLQKDNQIIC